MEGGVGEGEGAGGGGECELEGGHRGHGGLEDGNVEVTDGDELDVGEIKEGVSGVFPLCALQADMRSHE